MAFNVVCIVKFKTSSSISLSYYLLLKVGARLRDSRRPAVSVFVLSGRIVKISGSLTRLQPSHVL